MDAITIDDFKKVDLRVGRVTHAERVPNSEKLLRLTVDAGSESRQIIAGIGREHAPEALAGKLVVIAANLEPRTFLGLESNGMLLAASDKTRGVVLLTVEQPVAPGSAIR